ncbi:MAG: hypothetical protein K6T86_10770 [Pirellulales bacterium]|nr:hypothetical protein [Pirellulales bacterium]
MNLLAGGPEQGHRHLLCSALDWGQDLFELARWVRAHPEVAEIKVAYHGIMHPGQAGLRAGVPPTLKRPPATRASGVITERIAWAEEEEPPQAADAKEGSSPPEPAAEQAGVPEAVAWAEPGWYAVSVMFVMGGVCSVMDSTGRVYRMDKGDLSYFQPFEPVDRAGRSIWIYHLTEADWQRVIAQGWRPIEQP